MDLEALKSIDEIFAALPPKEQWVKGEKMEANGHRLTFAAHSRYRGGGYLYVYRCACGVVAGMETEKRSAPMYYTPLSPCPLTHDEASK